MSNNDGAGAEKLGRTNYVAIGLSGIAILASAGSCVRAGQANELAKAQHAEAVFRESVYRRAENCLAYSAHYYDRLPKKNGDNNEVIGGAYFDVSKALAGCAAHSDVSSIEACVGGITPNSVIKTQDGWEC